MPSPNSIDHSSSKKILPWLLACAIFMQMLDITILNTALPTMAKDLNESPLQMHLIIVSYTLVLAIFSPLSGILSDRFGTNRIFVVAIMLFSFGSLLCALAQTLTFLVIARVIQGLGGALLTPVARLALIKTYPKSELLAVLNYAIMPALLGPILGPVLGGYIVEWMGWHWIFLMNLPVGIILICVGFRYMPNYTDLATKIDFKGFAIFGSAIFLITLGLEYLSRNSNTLLALFIILAGATLLAAYCQYARKNVSSIFPLILFKIRTFRLGLSGNLISRLGISSVPFILPLFLQVGLGYSASTSGWMLVPLALASIMVKPVVVPLIHRYSYRTVLIFNTFLISGFIIGLGFFGAIFSKHELFFFLFLLGMCNSIQFSAMNSLTIADLRPNLTSSGNGLMVVNQQLAFSFSIAISAIFLNYFEIHNLAIFPKTTQAFQSTLMVVGLFTFFSAFIFMRLKKSDGDNLANRLPMKKIAARTENNQ